jgi:hypothetical protein
MGGNEGVGAERVMLAVASSESSGRLDRANQWKVGSSARHSEARGLGAGAQQESGIISVLLWRRTKSAQ